MSAVEGIVAVVGLALITVVTRAFFLFPDRDLPIPGWLQQGMRYAPLAALMAVIAPEIVMTQGELIGTWRDARLPAVVAAVGWFAWRRGILGTIFAGMAVLFAFRIGLGW